MKTANMKRQDHRSRPNAARMAVLREHERATWNAWVHHELHCKECQCMDGNPATPRLFCLDGHAAFDEWAIARDRHMEALGGTW